MKVNKILTRVDWLLLILYASLVVFGWFNIHAVSYEKECDPSIFDLSRSAGRQFVWIMVVSATFFIIFLFDSRTYQSLAYVFYTFAMLLLFSTLFWGVNVGGHKAWLQWGGQPSELAKLACSLAIAKCLDQAHTHPPRPGLQLILLGIVALPIAIIFLQGDVGSGLAFFAFFIVFYIERILSWLLLIGVAIAVVAFLTLLFSPIYLVVSTLSLSLLLIGLFRKNLKKIGLIALATLCTTTLIEGFHLFIEKVLKPYQQDRLKALIDPHVDPLGIGWNVTQSKIAIGSGGLWGKGFLQGTQTKYGFIPKQSTDFIFCTIGEEYGWIGAFLVVGVFLGLVSRIIFLAERQSLRFAKIYGYAVASILFFHFMINIGMTIGLMPVIGIPLPFISYGGSSLFSFSLMLFILLQLDSERQDYVPWQRDFLLS